MDFNNQDIYLGLSEKPDGPMKDSSKNRFLFFKKQGLDKKIIVSAGLINGNKVAILDNTNENRAIPDCDALITDRDKYLLTITVADCLPVYFYDKNKKVVALAHAGWRGITLEIVKEVINLFTSRYDSNLNDIEIFIGSHIKNCHFEVKEDVASQFKDSIIIRAGEKYIDLSLAVKDQLTRLGISGNNIKISQECTCCERDKYFSFRRDNPEHLETMVAYIGLK